MKESKQNNDSKTDRENEKNDKSKENAKEKEQNEEIVATKDLLPKDDEEWTQAKFLKNSRKFNLDLAPKVMNCFFFNFELKITVYCIIIVAICSW